MKAYRQFTNSIIALHLRARVSTGLLFYLLTLIELLHDLSEEKHLRSAIVAMPQNEVRGSSQIDINGSRFGNVQNLQSSVARLRGPYSCSRAPSLANKAFFLVFFLFAMS